MKINSCFSFAARNVLVRSMLVFQLSMLVTLPTVVGAPQTPSDSDCAGDTVDRLGSDVARRSRAFLLSLRDAVKSNDKVKVANMIQYPLRIGTRKRELRVHNSAEFIENYNAIMTETIKSRILDEKSSRCLFANFQGFMIGDGEVWFKEVSASQFKIFSINLDSDDLYLRRVPERAARNAATLAG
jgi:hypothetical protein